MPFVLDKTGQLFFYADKQVQIHEDVVKKSITLRTCPQYYNLCQESKNLVETKMLSNPQDQDLALLLCPNIAE